MTRADAFASVRVTRIAARTDMAPLSPIKSSPLEFLLSPPHGFAIDIANPAAAFYRSSFK
jgi:hypothetical protein